MLGIQSAYIHQGYIYREREREKTLHVNVDRYMADSGLVVYIRKANYATNLNGEVLRTIYLPK